jgi:hypothetical protein
VLPGAAVVVEDEAAVLAGLLLPELQPASANPTARTPPTHKILFTAMANLTAKSLTTQVCEPLRISRAGRDTRGG